MNSLYGNFRHRYFTEIYPNVEIFTSEVKSSPIPLKISDTSLSTLYYLLYSRYGNSVIVNSDENQFKYKLYSIIFTYGPTWEKRLDIQDKLRELSDDELMKGGKAIYNHAYNPGTSPSTASLDELIAINEQNTTNYKKSKVDAYANLMAILETDVTEEFLTKFKKLFLIIVEPELPLWYETEIKGDN